MERIFVFCFAAFFACLFAGIYWVTAHPKNIPDAPTICNRTADSLAIATLQGENIKLHAALNEISTSAETLLKANQELMRQNDRQNRALLDGQRTMSEYLAIHRMYMLSQEQK